MRNLPQQRPLRTGHKYPNLKIAQRVFLSEGDNFYLFQHVKLCRFTKFHGCIARNKEFTTVTSSEDWAQIPQSKNSTKGISELGGQLSSFSAYQIV